MFIDTHCHLQQITKYSFDVPLAETDFITAAQILEEAASSRVETIINVGTNLIESKNSIAFAQHFSTVFATIGIHPNDLTETWLEDIAQLRLLLTDRQGNKIVAIGECGMDKHYPDYNIIRQKDAFRAQIELALEFHLPLVIHTRDAAQETLDCLSEYRGQGLFGTIHCFSEDLFFAQEAIALGFVLGIGGTSTYPKNEQLREVIKTVGLSHIILETDAPFLPPQYMRGKQNRPVQIAYIAQYLAGLLETPIAEVARVTTQNARRIFSI